MKIQDRRFAKLSTRELHDIMRLRIDVFIVEQSCSYPELDGRDLEDGTRHVWMADDLGVVAYLMCPVCKSKQLIHRVLLPHTLSNTP